MFKIFFRELKEKIKCKNSHDESVKLLENEMNRYSLQKKQLEEDVQIIIQNFESAKYYLLKQVFLLKFVY